MNYKIAIARDEAFNFTYRANIEALAELGEVQFFSPLHDETLPPCQLLYLPGGYPELFAEQLAANESMRQSIRDYAEAGGRIYAECGGFMYLCRNIDEHMMCGVLPLSATMQGAHLHLGYRQMEWEGTTMRGHEFHYSDIVDTPADTPGLRVLRLQQSAKGTSVPTAIYLYRNVIAGYTHWYWGESGFPFWNRPSH